MNELLHRLTNRSGDFVTPAYSISNFDVVEDSKGIADIRDLLGLRDLSSDYCLRNLLSNLESFPELILEHSGKPRSYSPALKYVAPILNGARLYPGPLSGRRVFRVSSEWPVRRFIIITQISDTHLQAELKVSESATTSQKFTFKGGVGSFDLVSAEWPEALGIKGRLSSDWLPGGRVTIEHFPLFPWATLLAELSRIDALPDLLARHELLSYYKQAERPEESIAAVCSALAKDTPWQILK